MNICGNCKWFSTTNTELNSILELDEDLGICEFPKIKQKGIRHVDSEMSCNSWKPKESFKCKY